MWPPVAGRSHLRHCPNPGSHRGTEIRRAVGGTLRRPRWRVGHIHMHRVILGAARATAALLGALAYRCPAGRAVELGSFLQFLTRRWYKGNY